ncbi:MAG: hypothetical protein KAT15_03580, partial [Bacteroidales bacterium]|nr:hypothetical protein [Bacteroidales bacterium]
RIFDQMEVEYKNNAGTALSMMGKSSRIRIHFVTSFDEEVCKLMGALKTTVDQARQLIGKETGQVAWIENASLLYK